MSKVFYNKLVRDKIKETIELKDEQCEVREITDENEFQQELLKKIREEATALSHVRTRTDFLDEYADLMVVLDALTATMGFSEADVQIAIEENVQKKGFYNSKHFLHWSDDKEYVSNETPQGVKE
ncbi:MAG: putative house-cleaning noncanonical NTP pyrophosphatase (MazG superfamily) [Acidimicrobiales bacterium]|jgi:predicted house-cleaning noncanonical NTP pyrophosphatase (MazG superfamily)